MSLMMMLIMMMMMMIFLARGSCGYELEASKLSSCNTVVPAWHSSERFSRTRFRALLFSVFTLQELKPPFFSISLMHRLSITPVLTFQPLQ